MTLYLVRHAKAGDRSSWNGDDRLRPLSKPGRRQALLLADVLAEGSFASIVSSPYVRCTETVEPLAERRGLDVEEHDALAEGAWLSDVLLLVEKVIEGGAVLCSHGDVIPMLLEHYESLGVDLGPEPACAKGSTWVLDTADGKVAGARYLSPPRP